MPPTKRGLYEAISDGDLAAIRSLIGAGANVGARYADRSTPLHHAASAGHYMDRDPVVHVKIVKLLLRAGADPDAVDDAGDTPYDVAASDAIAALLKARTRPAKLGAGERATVAALRRDLAALRALIARLSTIRANEALLAKAAKKVVRWQWLSNIFESLEPHYSERYGFPRPRLLDHAPTKRELARGVTQVGLDREGRRVLERELMHTRRGGKRVVYDRSEPDLLRAVSVWNADAESWCGRVADGRLLTRIHVKGSADVYRWEGQRLVAVESWARLDRRVRRAGREELSHDLEGRLTAVVSIDEQGKRHSVFTRKAPGESLKSVAAAVRAELVRVIPEVVRRARIDKRAYCLILAWRGADLLPPTLAVGLERERARWRRAGDDSVWAATELELFGNKRLRLADPDLLRACDRMRELLQRSEDHRTHMAICRDASRELNRLDWSKLLPVTKDFVVFASDLELVGLRGHLRAILGPVKLKALTRANGCPPPA